VTRALSLSLILGLLAVAAPARAGSRQVELGMEGFGYRTGESTLNRDNVFGLDRDEGLLRLVLNWRESHGGARLVFRGFAERRLGSDPGMEWVAREAYGQYAWGESFSLRLGKQRVAWGSGVAWNPTNRMEPPKNPFNTSLEQEGVLAFRADWIPTPWAGVIVLGARSDAGASDLGLPTAEVERRGAALRVRFLVKETDLALVFSGGKNQQTLVGLDLARVLPAEISTHVEAAIHRGAEMAPARDDETFLRVAAGALRTFGERTSVAVEYFFNGEGYDDAEAAAYLEGLDELYARSLDDTLPAEAREAARAAYAAAAGLPYAGGLGLRRHYLHGSWTRRSPGERWTTTLRAVFGLSDGATAFTPGVSFAPRDDLTFTVDVVILGGPETSEYRMTPFRGSLQARMKLLF
jgi:hypothetical protein